MKKIDSLLNGNGEDDLEWITINGTHIPIKKGQDTQAIEQIIDDHFNNTNYVMLPKAEYKGLCSTIKSKYGNDIPNKGKILYKDHIYRYNYNSKSCRIICIKKTIINTDVKNYMIGK